MRIRNKIALIMGGMTVLVLAAGLLGGKVISRTVSLTAEKYYAEATEVLMRWEIQRELDALAFTTRDYAEWDRPGMFIETPDDPARNFEPEISDRILLRNRFGLAAVCRKDGTLLLGKCLDLKTGERHPLPEDLPDLLKNMVRTGLWQKPVKGFARLDGRVWGWSSHPVTRTDRSAPHNGFLIFGKPAEEILAEINSSPLSVLISDLSLRRLEPSGGQPQRGLEITEQAKTFPYRLYSTEDGTGRMRVDLTLYGLDGLPVALVTTATPGLFFHANLDLWNRVLTLGLLIGVVLTVVLYGLLTRMVSDPLERLRTFIIGLDPTRPVTDRLSSPGPGKELGELAESINRLLDTLETVREQEGRERDALQQSEEKFRTLFDQMVTGAALHEMIFDASGEPVDYRYLAVNEAFERLTGLKREHVLGRTVREILPRLDPFWIRFFGETVRTGRSAETIHEEPELGRFYEVRAYSPEAGQFVALFSDVTERVLQEKQRQLLLALTDRLNAARSRGEVLEALRECFNGAFGETETALYRMRESDAELVAGAGNETLEAIAREPDLSSEDPCFREERYEETSTVSISAAHRISGTGEWLVVAARVPGISHWDPWKERLFRTACGLADTTFARVMSEERLHRRLELEALSTNASMRFMRGEPGRIRELVRHTLEDIGRFCGASNVSLLLNLMDGQASDFFRWSLHEGMGEETRKPIDLRTVSNLYRSLHAGEVVQIDGLDSLPEDAAVERELVKSWGWEFSSIRIIPLMSEDGPAGLLTLVRKDQPDREWLREDLPQMRIIGDLLMMTWQRARTTEALRHRILTLLNPPTDEEGYPLEHLFDPEELQHLLEAFAWTQRVYAVILDAEGKPFTRPVGLSSAKTCPEELIFRLVRQIREDQTGGRLCICPMSGYLFWMAPIRAAHMLVGYWVIGVEAERVSGVPEDAKGADGPLWLTEDTLEDDALRGVFQLASQIAERLSHLALNNIRQAQLLARLMESEFLQRRLFTAMERAGDAMLFCDASGRVIYANHAAERLFDRWFSGLEDPQVFRPHVLPDARLTCDVPEDRWFREPRRVVGEFDFAGENGRRRYVAFSLSPIQDQSENRTDWLVVCQDISRLKELEMELIQSRKMEAVGNLASGIAHDFNNLLQVISGHAEILAVDLPEKSESRNLAQTIAEASHRAAILTQQLLTFSRQHPMRARPMDVNQCVTQLLKMLHRVLGEHITIEFKASEDLPRIYGDPSQIDQVLINLCVNARDAMPDGGRLTITTETVEFSGNYRTTHMETLPRGRYVCLSVADTGMGITPEILTRIFEPFFTTKEMGKGTGMGLATVYGIVSKHQGAIDVLSTPGRGTTFRIYLPVLKESESEPDHLPAEPGKADVLARLRGRRVLVAEDEASVRGMTVRFLQSAGVDVVEASNGVDALSRFRAAEGRFDALVLDVVMPGRNGREVYETVRETHPDIPVIFCTGYSIDLVNEEAVTRDRCCALLFKPYNSAALLGKLAELIRDSTGGG